MAAHEPGIRRLVNRESVMADLRAWLDEAAGGRGGVVLIGGEAGIGKTRLLKELRRDAVGGESRFIEGRCSEVEASVPYAPLMDALRFRLARGDGQRVAEILGPLRSLLVEQFPQLASAGAGAHGRADRPFELIFAALERLCDEGPVVLALEDIHWADPTTLDLLHHLSHRATAAPLLVVATYRTDEVPAEHPLRRRLAVLRREKIARFIQLQPLDHSAAMDLIRDVIGHEPDAALAETIWHRSQGNPFYIEELGTAVFPEAATASAETQSPLPATVRDLLLARAHALGPAAFETLVAAAVIGRHVDFDVLRDVLDADEDALSATLQSLVNHHLLREERGAGHEAYVFPHVLMRDALCQTLISRRRRSLHRKAALAIEARSSGPRRFDELSYHFRRGGDHEKAWHYAMLAAAEAARLGAWDDALVQYEFALAELETLGDSGGRCAETLEKLADVSWRAGRPAACAQYLEEATRIQEKSGDASRLARLLRRMAAIRAEAGDENGASNALEEAARLLGSENSGPELAAVYDDLGRLSISRGESDRAERLLLRGLSLASASHDSSEEVFALVSLGELGVYTGDVRGGVARLDLALELMREGGLPVHRAANAYTSGIRSLIIANEYTRALAWSDAARQMCVEQQIPGLASVFEAARAVILTITGSPDDTLADCQRCVEALRTAGRSELKDALRAYAFVHRIRGDLDVARASYEEAISLGEREATVGIALVDLASGKHAQAADRLQRCYIAVSPDQRLLALRLLPYVVESLVRSEQVEAADSLLAFSLEGDTTQSGVAERAFSRGLILAAREEHEAARNAFAAAANSWRDLGNAVEELRSEIESLMAMFAAGDTEEAVMLGRDLLARLDHMPRERERVRRALRRAGVRTRPAPRQGVATATRHGGQLTQREQAVLEQVALGRTNREIATRLGIAEKTVSVHVSHILEKLDCRTRTEAARYARPMQNGPADYPTEPFTR